MFIHKTIRELYTHSRTAHHSVLLVSTLTKLLESRLSESFEGGFIVEVNVGGYFAILQLNQD